MNIGRISQSNYNLSKILSKEEKVYLKKLFPQKTVKTHSQKNRKSNLYKARAKISLGNSIDIKI
ncbi:hypothetical protein DRQ09_05600 [candidate division KSB1 bacterium]|nr:MAG: hypothetical protein DRQ09_05600 [candidate division KSB1 bacterium]